MKSIKYTIASIVLLTITGLYSCKEDLLDVAPVNEFLSENYYLTDEQVFSSLVAAYDPLGWTMAYGQWISHVMYAAIRSDNAHAGGDPSNNDQPGWQELDDFTNTNTNTITHPIYRKYYIGIFRANLVINNAKISSPAVTRYQAEAKFLRAYYHFELFRHFGPIPVILEPLAPSDVHLSRNTLNEVFQAIVTDLTEAAAELPASISSGEAGRATKGAALALLGKAYIYWADMTNDDVSKFDLAAEALQQVVDLGIYSLEPDMKSLYLHGVKNPPESVFEIQQSNLYPGDWGWFEGVDGNGMIQLCGIRGLCDAHPTYEPGWGFMLATEDLYKSYLADDHYRRDAGLTSVARLTQEIADAGANCPVVVDVTQINPVDYTGYWQIKYANYKSYLGNNVNGGDPNLTKDANIYVIRYADVLLMLAESLHRGSGSDALAMNYIDMVRERAAGPGASNYRTSAQVMSDQGWSLLQLIQYERRAEFAMEGDRWFDLVRSGRATAELFNGDPRADQFDANDLWLPIPLQELNVSPELSEYPGPELFQ